VDHVGSGAVDRTDVSSCHTSSLGVGGPLSMSSSKLAIG
jgi:hypothetical protein